MKFVPTMAIEINQDTYPIAVACLPPVFATLSHQKVMDHILVINDLGLIYDKTGRRAAGLKIGNAWMKREEFDSSYTTIWTADLPFKFVPVDRV